MLHQRRRRALLTTTNTAFALPTARSTPDSAGPAGKAQCDVGPVAAGGKTPGCGYRPGSSGSQRHTAITGDRVAPPVPPARAAADHQTSGDGRSGWSGDRKSTRLNSSHVRISYAVFCLKKKKKRMKNMSHDQLRL